MMRGTKIVAMLALLLLLAVTGTSLAQNVVYLQGHVKNPGEYPVSLNPTLYRLLASHSGLMDEEFRGTAFEPRGEVIRARPEAVSPQIVTFNVTDVLNQEPGSNVGLRAGDVVRIYGGEVTKVFEDYVWITGYVREPGRYDLRQGMSLADLLIRAGGFEPEAYLLDAEVSRVDLMGIPGDTLTRVQSVQMLHTYSVADNPEAVLSLLYEGNTPASSFRMQPYDQVHVRKNPDMTLPNNVIIEGQVLYPGTYTLERRNETLSELIDRAGGFTADAFVAGGQLMRAAEDRGLDRMLIALRDEVKRTRDDLATRERAVQNISSTSSAYAASAPAMPFSEGANRLGAANAEIIEAYEIAIRDYQDATQAYEDAIQLKRGMKRINADFHALFMDGDYGEDVVLMPGDRIVIPNHPGTVTILGQVNNPGVYNFTANKTMEHYVGLAGGYTPEAGTVVVTQPTGYSFELRWLSNPKVMEGAVINVKRGRPDETLLR